EGGTTPRGVLVIVGGPQCRTGSHRQFTQLARDLAQRGIPTLRFDYRGMGDSAGERRDFEQVDQDIRMAVNLFFEQVPGLEEVVLWGLCDAASASLFYACQDPRVTGLVLANPWVRTVEGQARAQIKHYYRARLTDAAMWRKVLSGQFDFRASAGGILSALHRAFMPSRQEQRQEDRPLPERMRDVFAKFGGRTLLIISGEDLTAREFEDVVKASDAWRALLESPRVTRRALQEADHTFSRKAWKDQVADWTGEWLRAW
ncbi:hydrolase 1, exosortase A system-associated, partial [Ferrovum sp.]|uniref:hydrolase 1, exosortase A system-associated n=1 Tax=Ferrovum sp. TaxID=2609467 RepID=UPI00262CAB4B